MRSYIIKGFAGFAVLALVATGVPAYAETSTSVDQIQQLLKQIQDLQAQIAELQKKQVAMGVEIREALVLVRDLREGMTSDEVKALQEILAADPEIYPEGMVTGFYGALTARAVKKFQEKHGLEQAGIVGPKTRAKIQELLRKDDFKCKAWGHLIAPGLSTSTVAAKLDLSKCGKVPAGIAKKIDGDWMKAKKDSDDDDDEDEDEDEDEDDDTSPTIKGITASEIGETTATIEWRTNEKTKAVVWYGTDNDVDLDDAEKETVSSYKIEHELELEDLDDDTRYYFMVVATDESGNTATSSIAQFETDEE